jgi:hypothetical protein
MSTATITIGWTIHAAHPDVPHRYDATDYLPFSDTWRPGQPQHEETITVDLPDITEHPFNIGPRELAEAVFHATNAPDEPPADSLAGRVLAAIQATGFRGEGAHYSLSVGDTVTINGTTLACAKRGWETITEENDR